MPPTRATLREAFRAYFETIDLSIKGRAFWALLHVLVVQEVLA